MRGAITRLLLAVLGASTSPLAASGSAFQINKLASDQAGVATSTDPNLIGAWGIGDSAASPLWLAAHGSGRSVLYDGAGVKQALEVAIPGDGSVTGAVFNVAGSGAFNGDAFLFASEDGTVSGWRGALGTSAETLVLADSANVYKGIALATTGGHGYAYLANFRTGAIDVLKGDGAAPSLAGSFTDPTLPAGYAPFNVQVLGGVLYVAYAVQDVPKHDPVPGAGSGIVDRFDLNGNFQDRLITGGALNAPWGLELAPAGFADLAGNVLVGNLGDGRINAYDPTSGALLQTLQDQFGNQIAIDGLLGLRFGNGGNGGSATTLFFTASPSGGSHGLFGNLAAAAVIAPTLSATGLVALIVLLASAAVIVMSRRFRFR